MPGFQSDIHENKDWNIKALEAANVPDSFQSDIHENKDWNS